MGEQRPDLLDHRRPGLAVDEQRARGRQLGRPHRARAVAVGGATRTQRRLRLHQRGDERLPAGALLGEQPRLDRSQLPLADLDRAVVERWLRAAAPDHVDDPLPPPAAIQQRRLESLGGPRIVEHDATVTDAAQGLVGDPSDRLGIDPGSERRIEQHTVEVVDRGQVRVTDGDAAAQRDELPRGADPDAAIDRERVHGWESTIPRRVDLTLSPAEQAFRDELRSWLLENHPGREPAGDEAAFEFRLGWQRKLHAAGWAGVSWPKEYGGRGATLVEQAIFNEETVLTRTPQLANVLGLAMGGPTVIAHGTEEQRRRYLPPILSGDEIWCQGFSEPDSGSDLASVKTRATRDGDEWIVNGQKVWTTYAHHAKWCMLVARTDPDAPKHKGLTYFLMDMKQDAVQVRPLRQITGEAEFNELFIEEARIPHGNIVGGEGNGWAVAITTLMHERATLAFGLQVSAQIALDELLDRAQHQRATNGHVASQDPVVRQRLAQLLIESEVLRLNAYRGLTAIMRDGVPGPEGSLGKWHWSEVNQSLTELAMDIAGPRALRAEDEWTYRFLRARANSIEGGTTEILKNIVAERVLGLPRMR